MAARDIVKNLDLKLIGPTTGLSGLFHGVWWYYFLTIPYILTGGNPTGFYAAIFLLGAAWTVLFSFFIKRELGLVTGLLALLLLSVSPYFIKTSLFAINSVLALPFLALFLYSLYQYLKVRKPRYLFLISFSIGFIAEAELAFGLFLIPAFIISIFAGRVGKKFFGSVSKIRAFLVGFAVPFAPRVIFELKNGFMQTRTLIEYFYNPADPHPSELKGLVWERLKLFREFYFKLFSSDFPYLGIIIGVIALGGLLIGYKRFLRHQKRFVQILVFMLAALYGLSLLVKNSFFWANYFEGLPLLYLMIILIGFHGFVVSRQRVPRFILASVTVFLVVMTASQIYLSRTLPREQNLTGLRVHTKTIEYLYDQAGKAEFCARIYTPPVIPHTYNYLLDYYAGILDAQYPRTEYIDNKCFYIIESDANKERRAAWIADNISEDAQFENREWISRDVMVELWKME